MTAPKPELIERFALEYLQDLNGTQAYLRVRPDSTPAAARVSASRLLANANVQAKITELRAKLAAELKITAADVLRELQLIGFSDFQHYETDPDTGLQVAAGQDPRVSRAVSSVKQKTTSRTIGKMELVERTSEFRLWNKPEALKLLGQHLGLFQEENQLPPGGREIRVRWVNELPSPE